MAETDFNHPKIKMPDWTGRDLIWIQKSISNPIVLLLDSFKRFENQKQSSEELVR